MVLTIPDRVTSWKLDLQKNADNINCSFAVMEELLPPTDKIIQQFAERGIETRLNIYGKTDVLNAKPGLVCIVNELISNCVNQKAREITVRINDGSMSVEDDVRHRDADAILANINSRYPQTTKQPLYDTETYENVLGGIGIQDSRKRLEDELHGSLTYQSAEDGRIIAIVSWE